MKLVSISHISLESESSNTWILTYISDSNSHPLFLKHTFINCSRSMLAMPFSVVRVRLGIITISTLCPPSWSNRTLPGGLISACTTTSWRSLRNETHGVRSVTAFYDYMLLKLCEKTRLVIWKIDMVSTWGIAERPFDYVFMVVQGLLVWVKKINGSNNEKMLRNIFEMNLPKNSKECTFQIFLFIPWMLSSSTHEQILSSFPLRMKLSIFWKYH